MSIILISIICFGITGALIGLGLAFANKFLSIKYDPRIEKIISILPGVNCGACGFPGCAGYAEAIITKGSDSNKCTVGGNTVAKKIAELLGIEAKIVERSVARVFCRGGKSKTYERFHYRGIISCQAVQIVAGGNKSCTYGCLGMGDCVRVCAFGALSLNEDNIPTVIEEKCTACGRCVIACPRGIIALVPVSKRMLIACRSLDKGPDTKKACAVGCIGCKLCEKKCPEKAILVEGNLARVNYEKCKNIFACVAVCPQKTIVTFPPTDKEHA